jgi:mannose-6-phosphate isomerase class I
MIRAPYFVVDQFQLKERQTFHTEDEARKRSAHILVAVEGCGVVEGAGMEPVTLAKGDAAVIPASVGLFAVRPQWSVEFLKAYVPSETPCEPETRL